MLLLVIANQMTACRLLSGILIKVACERPLEMFKFERLKDLQWEALQKFVGSQDVVLLWSTGLGKFVVPERRIMNKVNKEGDKPKHRAQETKHSIKLMYSLLEG